MKTTKTLTIFILFIFVIISSGVIGSSEVKLEEAIVNLTTAQETISILEVKIDSLITTVERIEREQNLGMIEQDNQLQLIELNIDDIECVRSEIHSKSIITTKVTTYQLTVEQCNEDLANTATMKKPIPGETVAVSRDLDFLLGQWIYIDGHGVRHVTDRTSSKLSKTVDVLIGINQTPWSIPNGRIIPLGPCFK